MAVFKSHYYKINLFYLKLLGLWPFDKKFVNKTKNVTIILLITSLCIPQAIKLWEEWGKNANIMLETSGSLMYFGMSQIKYMSCIRVQPKMKYLYEKIMRHWSTFSSQEDINMLRECATIGRKLTIGYAVLVNVALTAYLSLPLVPVLLDVVKPLNETRPRVFPYFAEYFVDDQKYYFQLSVHGWVVCTISAQLYVVFHTNCIQCAQHACGLFLCVEQRLQRATAIATNKTFLSKTERDAKVYLNIVDAVHLHKEAIQCVNLMDDSFTLCYFVIVIFGTIIISFAAVVTLLRFEAGEMEQTIRFGGLYIGFTALLFVSMYPGQTIAESSANVKNAVFHSNWFNTCPKSKQLIKIIMLRSSVPCQYTAGKLVTLNFESFGFVFKKSVSLVTIIASIR
ncbi:uncharacterized protein LOC106637244 [Copidosoma floridanum]|uniref:uncharacterized protein LOC106637244 n=1 Tax=Copidosoma floridanum TaxID=29053 RepID=UPI0006C9BC14|nr:uncharacterized protein LOC106637244 [Copidosoma floridanum]